MRKPLLLALSLLGLFDSAYLWWAYTSPSRPMVCLGSGCDAIRASAYSHLWGLPLPVYGAAMFTALAVLIFCEVLPTGRAKTHVRYAFWGISGLGLLVSLYLTAIEGFVLHAWCAWCVVSALSVTSIFVLGLSEGFKPPAEHEPAVLLATARKLLAVVVVALAAGAPAFLFLMHSEKVEPRRPASAHALGERLVRPESHVTGNPEAPLTIVEFADFECSYCKQAEQTAREVRKKFGGEVRFVFRHFPMDRLHPQAEKAAEASECAAEQGKFWEAEEKFYDMQKDLSEAALERYAQDLGLDRDRFRQCLSSGVMAARVRRDADDGRALGVRWTPTFVIGTRIVEGALEPAEFIQLVQQELASRGATPGQSQKSAAAPRGAGPASAPPRPSAKKQPSDSKPGSSGLFASNTGGIFTQFQGSGLACSEEEARKQQPILIRTPDARQFFEGQPKALFVDLRAPKEYASGRIPGAINVPADKIEARWSELPRDRNIVFYESGTSAGDVCAFGRAAGRVLLAHGFSRDQVKVYQDGLAGWEKVNLPVEH
jgi:protein-disulfide isomerase/rhodanese-related sulfurtransferase/uncharacterized membrane protein